MAGDEPLELVVAGHCMSPALECGDRIRVARKRAYLPGDVVAFRRGDDRLLVHRVLGYTLSRQGLRLVAKGDHLAREDEPVLLASVVGRVVASRGIALRTPLSLRAGSLLRFLGALARRSIRPWVSATSS